MKNIHVLPTEKPSVLKQNNITKKISLVNKEIDLTAYTPINIYITSDEEIKEGDWVLFSDRNLLYKVEYTSQCFDYNNDEDCKKIILTTDQDLIKDGVQAIDDEFIEWFVKNPSCEEVEVKKEYITPLGDIVETCYDNERLNYQIIIPKEEAKKEIPQIGTKEFNDLASAYFGGKPKQYLEKEMFDLEQELDVLSNLRWHNSKPKQETLEEAINNQIKNIDINSSNLENIAKYNRISGTLLSELKKSMANIAKWQQERMYSEEEVKEIIYLTWLKCLDANGGDFIDNRNEILEQFKNK